MRRADIRIKGVFPGKEDIRFDLNIEISSPISFGVSAADGVDCASAATKSDETLMDICPAKIGGVRARIQPRTTSIATGRSIRSDISAMVALDGSLPFRHRHTICG